MRKFIVSAATGLAIVTGAAGIAAFTPLGTAFAQNTGPTATQEQHGSSDTKHDGSHRQRMRKAVGTAVKDAAGVIGISPKELGEAMRSGQSIAQVASAHGVDAQAVIDKLVADATTKIDQAVTDGKITQERADTAKSKLTDRVSKLVNHVFDGSKAHRPAKSDQGN